MDNDVITSGELTKAGILDKERKPFKKYWFHGSQFVSSYSDTASLMGPRGEKFVISAVSKLLPKVKDEKLKSEMANLLHEEESHGKVHEAYNQGVVDKRYSTGLIIRIGSLPFDLFEKVLSPIECMAIAMCLEYFTFFFSKHMVENELFKGVDERLERLWLWHCLEEMEHRGACFDLYNYLGGGYFSRAFAMILATIVFVTVPNIGHAILLHQNRGLYKPKVWLEGLSFLFGRKGIYWAALAEWPKYFLPGFHPNQIPVKEQFRSKLHHHHIEDELVAYFSV